MISPADPVSLQGLHRTVAVPPPGAPLWPQLRAFAGPGLLISVGYMDPGNWGTDLQAGAQFRYGLLWVVAVASLMAIVLQLLAARLGIALGRDLAQLCRDHLPRWTRLPNWLLCEAAIGACDLAEVLGSAVALNLLFHIPLLLAVLITGADVLLLLALQRLGMRWIEALAGVLVATIALCYVLELFVLPRTTPNLREIGGALLHPGLAHAGMTTIAIGIIGATVMPHNLYLHSALVQSRALAAGAASRRRAIQINTADTVLSLSLALFVNAAILVLAALVFNGQHSVTADGVTTSLAGGADWIRVAYLTLAPLVGTAAASLLFGIALLASGQSSTITGTMAGQVVMEGFLHWHVAPWLRRLVTRALAILPAILLIGSHGGGTVNDLLVLSQVVLALQLPLAMFPLLYFSTSRRFMGVSAPPAWLAAAGWTTAILITALDLFGLPEAIGEASHIVTG